MRILIKGGTVVDAAQNIEQKADVYMEDGVILEIGENLDYDGYETDVIDASGKIVAAGLVDMHCHLREPGFEYKEDIESGAKSAVMGGFTSIACMPNTNPPIDNRALAQFVLARSAQVGAAKVYPIGAISKGLAGEALAEIGEMKFAGVVGVSDDGKPVANAGLMRRALQYAAMFDVAVISHCEELSLLDGGSMNEGAVAASMGLRGISPAVEEVMVSRDILLAKAEDVPVHIAHVSTRGSVQLVRDAKKQGIKVTCETCPHYFTLTEEAVCGFNTNAKMNPPLRTKDDVAAIIEGLADGTIDVIATDHAPHHIDEKNVEFERAANGIVGFETALCLAATYLVKPGHLSLLKVLEKMTVNPARILGLNAGVLAPGKIADVVIFDPEEAYTVKTDQFLSKSKNSPYDGFSVYGKVCYTIVGGKVVVRQGELMI